MQAGAYHATSGVTLTFYTPFNAILGTASYYNTTNPPGLGLHQTYIDVSQHQYAATMASFASEAGLDATVALAKLGLRFESAAANSPGGTSVASASVWFDNVRTVSAVPEPASGVALLAGLALLAAFVWPALRPSSTSGRHLNITSSDTASTR